MFNKIVAEYEAETGKKLKVTRTSREELAKRGSKGDLIAFLLHEWDIRGGAAGSPLTNDLSLCERMGLRLISQVLSKRKLLTTEGTTAYHRNQNRCQTRASEVTHSPTRTINDLVRSSPDDHPAFLPEPGEKLIGINVKVNFGLRSELHFQSVFVP